MDGLFRFVFLFAVKQTYSGTGITCVPTHRWALINLNTSGRYDVLCWDVSIENPVLEPGNDKRINLNSDKTPLWEMWEMFSSNQTDTAIWDNWLHWDGGKRMRKISLSNFSPSCPSVASYSFSSFILCAHYVHSMHIYFPRWPALCASVQIRKQWLKVAPTFSDKVAPAEQSRESPWGWDVTWRAVRPLPPVFLLVWFAFDLYLLKFIIYAYPSF